jgi:RNA polymerase sigma-70 factor (sigma-E family)
VRPAAASRFTLRVVRAVATDEYDSFVAFVVARHRALVRSATLVSGDPDLAQDLVQDALVKLAARWDRLGAGRPEAYALRILYRDLVSWRRRFRRERLGVAGDRSVADQAGSVDDRLVLASALARLTVKQRAVLVLRFYEDLSEYQAAELLGVSVGTVKSQTHAALARLRVLAPELETLVWKESGRD